MTYRAAKQLYFLFSSIVFAFAIWLILVWFGWKMLLVIFLFTYGNNLMLQAEKLKQKQ